MRIRFALLVAVLVANTAFAVTPQFWRVRTGEEFLAGEVDGFAVTSRGELKPGPTLKKIGSFTDPFVLSQAKSPDGDRFFGTGNEGKVYRLHGSELKVLYTAPESEIYATTWHDGALFIGTSPNGKVYRVDPSSGKATPFYDPKQAYIWAIDFLPSGDLVVATGVEGKLFRVTPKGEGRLWFDAPEAHLRSLAVRPDGSVLAGGSGKGRIYEVRADGNAHALFDSALSEISSIYIDPTGIAWAAGVSNVLPSAPPAKPQAKPAQGTAATASSSAEPRKDDSPPAVETGFSFDDQSGAAGQAGSAELYRIDKDGFVEIVRKFDHEMIYGLSGGRDGALLLSTGPQGRIYEFRDGEVSLVGTVPEKQIVSISTEGGETIITTTNSGAIYRMTNAPSPKAEFRSAAKDLERFSRFGHYKLDGTDLGSGHITISFRSGNTRTPDATWSSWSSGSTLLEGRVDAPAGRYVQWKLNTPTPSSSFIVDNVSVGYINRNVAPVIDSVSVQEPAVVFINGSYPASPQVVEATNPDENGIFTSLDTPRERNEQGKKLFRKGYRTIAWRAHDDNGDSLRYTLSFRRKGNDKWLVMRKDTDETQLNFDTSQLPDGIFEIRLSATDANENAEGALTQSKEGVDFQVDNTPPRISFTSEGDDLVIHVTDSASTIGRVEYSIDAQKWTRMVPTDGIADSSDETYRVKRGSLDGKFVIVRAVDAFYNVATESMPAR